MFLQHTLIAVVVIPYVLGKNSTVVGEKNVISNTNVSDTIKLKIFNEGGAQEEPSLNKENDLLNFGKEIAKIKKTSSVVRKNGVKFTQDQQESVKLESSETKQLNTSETKGVQENTLSTQNVTSNKIITDTKQENRTIIHKPLILSYDALSKMDKNLNRQSSLPNIHSSSKTVPDQVPSPNEEASKAKSYTMNPVKHPGMIMPIVITILVVPMFAVLGYMAVKRGKEAWKNRHYKRMDFLLDGMYND